MNFATKTLLYFGSGEVTLFGTSLLLGIASPLQVSRGAYLGRFVPYLERAFFLSWTPNASKVPRMMW